MQVLGKAKKLTLPKNVLLQPALESHWGRVYEKRSNGVVSLLIVHMLPPCCIMGEVAHRCPLIAFVTWE